MATPRASVRKERNRVNPTVAWIPAPQRGALPVTQEASFPPGMGRTPSPPEGSWHRPALRQRGIRGRAGSSHGARGRGGPGVSPSGCLCGQRGPPDSGAPQPSRPQNAVFSIIRRVPRRCTRLCPCGRGSQSGCCPSSGTSRQVSAVAPGGLAREDRPGVGHAGAQVCTRARKVPEPHAPRSGLRASAGRVGPTSGPRGRSTESGTWVGDAVAEGPGSPSRPPQTPLHPASAQGTLPTGLPAPTCCPPAFPRRPCSSPCTADPPQCLCKS